MFPKWFQLSPDTCKVC